MDGKQRYSNVELLRIVAMLMIVAHHFSVHGGFSYDESTISINLIWIQFLRLGGKIGVDVFVLISGYYLVSSKSSKTYKALKLWLQMLFYSLLIFTISILLNLAAFSKKALLDAFFPVSMDQWWFASTYFILLLLSPFINIALKTMSKKQYQQLLLLVFILWSVLPSLSGIYPKFTIIAPQSSNLVWFIALYIIAAYIRLWHPSLTRSARYYLTVSACMYMVTLLSAVAFDYLNTLQLSVVFNPIALFEMTSITILIASITALLGFLQIDMSFSKVINTIASATFGVYLLHDQDITRPLLWKTIFKNATYANSNLLIPYSVAVIMIVYLSCTLLELIRIKIIEKPCSGVIYNLSNIIDEKMDALFRSTLSNRL